MHFFLTAAYSQTKASRTPVIGQFFGIWLNPGQTWEQKLRVDTPFASCNRLYIAFGKIIQVNGHFSIAFDGSTKHATDLIDRMRAVHPNADIFITVGGDNKLSSYGGAANDTEFAQHVLAFLLKYQLNGFDIDWENNLDKKNLNHLVRQLYEVLHASHHQLTLDVWPFPDSAYDMPILKNNVDQINIMSYGAGTSLRACVESYERAGFPTFKMIGGIETETGYPGGTDTLGLSGTITQKATDALSHGLAGMMEWRLDNDYATAANPNYPTYQGALQLWESMIDSVNTF